MWIVKVALQRPYTFIMLAVLIVLMGGYAILKTATDIFPNIKIPIAAVIWRYNGILPEEIANRIVLFSERVAQTTVNDVEHTESQSVNGTAVVKYFFQPDADQDLSMSQITAVSQVQLAFSPPGTTPPFVLSYSASSVPILQLALSSETLPESQIYDLANTVVRTQLATVAGASIPYPFGGKQRQVQVDLDPQALRARGLSGKRRRQRHQRAESDTAGRHPEDRAAGVLRQTQRQPGADRGVERSADTCAQRQRHHHPRRRSCPRRLLSADQHGAARWPAGRLDERVEDRQGLHHRHHQQHQ